MRIAMLTNNYKPYVGGVPVSIEHLAKELRRSGHTVYIFAPSYPGQEEDPFVIRYPSFPLRIAGAPVPNVLTGLIFRRVRELGIDLIHVHHPAITGNVALRLRRQLKIPVVFTYHTRYEEYLYYVKTFRQVERCTGIFEGYLRYFCNCCDMVIAPTQEIKDHIVYEKKVGTPVGILPTGLPRESFMPDVSAVKRIRECYLKGADHLFCTVARLAKEKNLDLLLSALRQYKDRMAVKGKTFRHMIIGEGLERDHLIKRCRSLGLEEEIVFLGNVEHHAIKDHLSASDLFLFTSRSETQGIVVLEAMAVGTPVVAVAASGIRDIVETGRNGILTMEDPGLFAQAMDEMMSDPARYRALSEGAGDTAKEYTEEKIARIALHYYTAVSNLYQDQDIHAILV